MFLFKMADKRFIPDSKNAKFRNEKSEEKKPKQPKQGMVEMDGEELQAQDGTQFVEQAQQSRRIAAAGNGDQAFGVYGEQIGALQMAQ